MRIEADGTDLTLRVAGRTWVNSDGKRNMPSGEVFTGPHENSANGRIRFTVRSAPQGVDVDGVELEFRDGEVVGARADTGDEYLQRALETDGGARFLGELGHRDELRHRPPDGHDPVRREDRRHGPPRARPLVSRDRRQERVAPCTGTSSATCAQGGRLTADGDVLMLDGRFARV